MRRLLTIPLCAALLAAAGGPLRADEAARTEPYARRLDVPALGALGRAIFFDRTLSASGRVACASCHDPAHAYGPPNALAVQPGGGAARGFRAAPSLRYLHSVPAFDAHHFDNDGDDSVDLGPTGGHGWDGRAGSARAQARQPLLSAAEMGNADAAAVVAKLRRAPYAAQLRAAFGADVLERGEAAFDAALLALEVFQQTPAEFYPYSSRFDAVLREQAALSAQEARGLALFNDPAKGNCASCHLSEPRPDGAFPLFTDFGHIAIGVPRNRTLAANADPRLFDLGLCGPLRTDLAAQADYCGRFRTPTLRNVALRRSFFHNGTLHTLTDAVRFYATRDIDPARWYGRDARGQPRRFDDLPARYHRNVNTEPPFGGEAGAAPALDEAEIAAIVAFLKTLTDADQQADQQPDQQADQRAAPSAPR
ncbi:MAG TPA: cytochrome c peroxidase [Burkholderiaceae bacterium]|nr:cytochrome c peroxidase [Burkholderiaceae bacterium]